MITDNKTQMVFNLNFLNFTDIDVANIVGDYLLWGLLGYETEAEFDEETLRDLCWKSAVGNTNFTHFADEIMIDYNFDDKFVSLYQLAKDLIIWMKNEYAGMFIDIHSSLNITDVTLGYVDNLRLMYMVEYH